MGTNRGVGIALLALAAFAAVVIGRVNGRDVPGQAQAAPLPAVPAVNTCLTTPAADPADADPVVVPCTAPHTSEVLQSWRKGQQPSSVNDLCGGHPGATWSSEDGNDWSAPTPWMSSRYLDGGGPLGWVACVSGPVAPGTEPLPLTFTGSLAEDPSGRSLTVGACYQAPDRQVDCSTPHRSERVGVYMWQPGAATPATSCTDFARQQVGAAAFTGAHPLRATESQDTSVAATGASISDSSGTRTEIHPLQTCLVQSSDPGRLLTASVVHLGDRSIPYG